MRPWGQALGSGAVIIGRRHASRGESRSACFAALGAAGPEVSVN